MNCSSYLITITVPGSDERKLKSTLKLAADSIVLDLEDGVAHNRKLLARQLVAQSLAVCKQYNVAMLDADYAIKVSICSVWAGAECREGRSN
jgi:citrate lyase beta subunit